MRKRGAKGRLSGGGHKNEWLSTGAMCNMSPTATATLPSGPSQATTGAQKHLQARVEGGREGVRGRGGGRPSNEYC